MARQWYLAAAAAAVLALAAGPALAGCGGDDEDANGGAEVEQTDSPTDPAAPYGEDDEGPLVPDEGHEGGGPDPGTDEAEGSTGGGRYGGGGGGGGGGSKADDGLTPPERFEQFCKRNPEACG